VCRQQVCRGVQAALQAASGRHLLPPTINKLRLHRLCLRHGATSGSACRAASTTATTSVPGAAPAAPAAIPAPCPATAPASSSASLLLLLLPALLPAQTSSLAPACWEANRSRGSACSPCSAVPATWGHVGLVATPHIPAASAGDG
jgi:2-oxoglutarate dehydrogenase E2 component (dihydrolipoamide succinyltransferase)